MAFEKGNKYGGGKKGRSGRRPLSEELINKAREKHYEELAKEAVSRALEAIIDDTKEIDFQEVKDIAMPIVVKGIKSKTEFDASDELKKALVVFKDGRSNNTNT